MSLNDLKLADEPMLKNEHSCPKPLLSENDAKALLAFLSRVDLKGAEAPVLMVLIQKLQSLLPRSE